MEKMNIKVGSKLDVVAELDGEEQEMKSSYVKSVGGKMQITMPMHNGKSILLGKGTVVAVSCDTDNGRYTCRGTVDSSVKQGVRTNLLIALEEEAQWVERRAFRRIPAELNIKIFNYNTDLDGNRRETVSPGRTTDISNGGVAVLTSASLAVGETVNLEIARRGTKKIALRSEVCWTKSAPQGSGYRYSAGLQFVFTNNESNADLVRLTTALAEKR